MVRLILLACSLTTAFAAERIFSVGIKGGVPLTDAFADHTFNGVDTLTHSFSDSKNYAIGPTVELSLPFGFAVEADALYRPLNLATDATLAPRPATHFSTNINAWEFPILGKYHFLHTPVITPEIRLSRWAGDARVNFFGAPPSQLNQAEFLIGISF